MNITDLINNITNHNLTNIIMTEYPDGESSTNYKCTICNKLFSIIKRTSGELEQYINCDNNYYFIIHYINMRSVSIFNLDELITCKEQQIKNILE